MTVPQKGGLSLAMRFLLPALALIILVSGLFTDSMDVDATQYALMSKELLESDNWLHFFCRGVPYLDKPPLIFWVTAISYKIFGVSNWSYKLPSLLIMLWGTFGLFKAVKIWYDKQTAELTILIYTLSFWSFMIAQDVKTDNLLIGFSCLSFWGISEWLTNRNLKWIFVTSIFQSLALMAKGPIASVSLFAGIGLHLILKKQWNKIIDWHWIVLILTILVCLMPMTYGLYTQYGETGVRFFYWTQSFGRITGDSTWSNELGPDFFVHTTLWAFMPWTPLAIVALVNFGHISLIRQKKQNQPEWLAIGSFILPFIALSTSRFKLPHYIFITYPYLSIITAIYLKKISDQDYSRNQLWTIWSILLLLLVSALAGILLLVVFPTTNYLTVSIVSGLLFIGFIAIFHPDSNSFIKWGAVPGLSILILGLTLNFHFYPKLLEFQSGSTAGRWISSHCSPDVEVFGYKLFGYSLDLYANRRIEQIEDVDPIMKALSSNKTVFLLLKSNDFELLKSKGLMIDTKSSFPSFHVSLLTPKFLNPKSRDKVLESIFIAKVSIQESKNAQIH